MLLINVHNSTMITLNLSIVISKKFFTQIHLFIQLYQSSHGEPCDM